MGAQLKECRFEAKSLDDETQRCVLHQTPLDSRHGIQISIGKCDKDACPIWQGYLAAHEAREQVAELLRKLDKVGIDSSEE